MFKLDLSDTFLYPIAFDLPTQSGVQEVSFNVQYARLGRKELKALNEKIANDEVNDDALLQTIIKGWDGIVDSQNQPLPFSLENLALLSNIIPFSTVLIQNYFKAINETRLKN